MIEIKFKKPSESELGILVNEFYEDILNFYNSQIEENENSKNAKYTEGEAKECRE